MGQALPVPLAATNCGWLRFACHLHARALPHFLEVMSKRCLPPEIESTKSSELKQCLVDTGEAHTHKSQPRFPVRAIGHHWSSRNNRQMGMLRGRDSPSPALVTCIAHGSISRSQHKHEKAAIQGVSTLPSDEYKGEGSMWCYPAMGSNNFNIINLGRVAASFEENVKAHRMQYVGKPAQHGHLSVFPFTPSQVGPRFKHSKSLAYLCRTSTGPPG